MKNVTLLAVAAVLVLLNGGVARAGSTSCDALDIHVKSDVLPGKTACKTVENMGGGPRSTTESIEIEGNDFYFFMYHNLAGSRTYVTQEGFETDLKNSTSFESIEDITTYASSQGFTVRRFTGVDDGTPFPCFAITRYSGRVFSGYRHFVFGMYCEFSGDSVPSEHIDEVMSAIHTDFE